MKFMTFNNSGPYKFCFLVPSINKNEIEDIYFNEFNFPKLNSLILDLYKDPIKKKTSAKDMKTYLLEEVQEVLIEQKVKYLIVCDADYYKQIAKTTKVEANLGYVSDSIFENIKVTYVPNYKSVFYNPKAIKSKINIGIKAILNHDNGSYSDPGNSIIKKAYYPKTYEEIKDWLNILLEMDCNLTCDIETFSLKHYDSGLGTITFCWNHSEGVAFQIDSMDKVKNEPIRQLLKDFFIKFKKKLIFHHIAFDGYILIYQLFMNGILDTKGMYEGFSHILKNWEDTKLIAYLATNSCAGNKLSLKDLAQEFAGNYAMTDIDDITKIDIDKLLEYNLIDGLSTWYVYHEYYPTMLADQQADLYENEFKKYTKDIIQMHLTGLPVNMDKAKEIALILKEEEDNAIKSVLECSLIKQFIYKLNEDWVIAKNKKYKVKRVTLEDANETFNFNSSPQLQDLLFNFLDLPILDLTDNKQPATGGDILEKLKNHTDNEEIQTILTGLINYKAVNKINNSFIPAILNAYQAEDGWHYMFGNFNLGGTVSGRLSSNSPK